MRMLLGTNNYAPNQPKKKKKILQGEKALISAINDPPNSAQKINK